MPVNRLEDHDTTSRLAGSDAAYSGAARSASTESETAQSRIQRILWNEQRLSIVSMEMTRLSSNFYDSERRSD